MEFQLRYFLAMVLYEFVLHSLEDEKRIEKASVYLVTTRSAGMVGICLVHKVSPNTKLSRKSNWAVLNDEQMSKREFSRLMGNKVGGLSTNQLRLNAQ